MKLKALSCLAALFIVSPANATGYIDPFEPVADLTVPVDFSELKDNVAYSSRIEDIGLKNSAKKYFEELHGDDVAPLWHNYKVVGVEYKAKSHKGYDSVTVYRSDKVTGALSGRSKEVRDANLAGVRSSAGKKAIDPNYKGNPGVDAEILEAWDTDEDWSFHKDQYNFPNNPGFFAGGALRMQIAGNVKFKTAKLKLASSLVKKSVTRVRGTGKNLHALRFGGGGTAKNPLSKTLSLGDTIDNMTFPKGLNRHSFRLQAVRVYIKRARGSANIGKAALTFNGSQPAQLGYEGEEYDNAQDIPPTTYGGGMKNDTDSSSYDRLEWVNLNRSTDLKLGMSFTGSLSKVFKMELVFRQVDN
ncbi:MAG: hypothetical protein AAF203_06765 [Pseudomonadota bacterium]